uniref:Apple domain-containing protein n=1 Tax=Plectus sambesii TaxID=2011161 RepID=A0A914UJ85_9BILA
MSAGTNSYRVGGWCFLIYRNPSWPNNTPLQNAAQTVCHPYGTLAVAVTYKMLYELSYGSIWGAATDTILPLTRNISYPTPYQGAGLGGIGWYWSVLMPNGGYATFPAIMSNIPWGPGGANPSEPNNQLGNEKIASVVKNYGVCDAQATYSIPSYGARAMGVICQFAPLTWNYSQRGHGLMANSTFIVEQKTVKFKPECILKCHQSVFCISLAFNPTTNDCQIYAVSPEDPRFAGSVIADNAYDLYIRDGMEY